MVQDGEEGYVEVPLLRVGARAQRPRWTSRSGKLSLTSQSIRTRGYGSSSLAVARVSPYVVVFVVRYIRSVGGRRSSAAGASRPLALDVDVVGRSPEEACHTVRHGDVDAARVACS